MSQVYSTAYSYHVTFVSKTKEYPWCFKSEWNDFT